MKFGRKIFLVLILIATIPVAFSGALAVRYYQDEMMSKIDQFNRNSAKLAADSVEDFLLDVLKSVTLTTKVIPFEEFPKADLRDALNIPYRQFDYLNIVALFDENEVRLSEPAFEENPSGYKGLEGHAPVSAGDVERFSERIPFEAARHQEHAFGEPYFSIHTASPRIPLAVTFPVAKGGQHWFLVVEISLTKILDKIHELASGDGRLAFIVDKAGRAVFHSRRALMADRRDLSRLAIIERGMKAARAFTTRFVSQDGQAMTGAYAPIHALEWGLVVADPVEKAFEPVTQVRNSTIFWVILGLAVAIMGGVLLGHGLTSPLAKLTDGAKALSKRDFKWRIPVESKDELGQLAEVFNQMADELRVAFDTITKQQQELIGWNEELKERVKARTAELREAEEQIIRSQKMEVVAQLSAGMAHEVNNPLTSILGFSQYMLLQTDQEDKRHRYLKAIVDGAGRIRGIVDDLVRFAKSGANANHTQIELNALIERTLSIMGRQFKEASIDVVTRLKASLPEVAGDPTELQQAFVQILNNAVTAMPEGGTLTLVTEEIDAGAIRFSIADTGVGIPEENLSKIFDLFFTTKDEWNKKGFGLSVADRIIRDHQGKITVASQVNEGSTFAILLPGLKKGTHLDTRDSGSAA